MRYGLVAAPGTDAYLPIFKELWTSPNPSFQGRYCQFEALNFLSKPVHAPIHVGTLQRSVEKAAQRAIALCGGNLLPI